jgi:hypothetical protein
MQANLSRIAGRNTPFSSLLLLVTKAGALDPSISSEIGRLGSQRGGVFIVPVLNSGQVVAREREAGRQ